MAVFSTGHTSILKGDMDIVATFGLAFPGFLKTCGLLERLYVRRAHPQSIGLSKMSIANSDPSDIEAAETSFRASLCSIPLSVSLYSHLDILLQSATTDSSQVMLEFIINQKRGLSYQNRHERLYILD